MNEKKVKIQQVQENKRNTIIKVIVDNLPSIYEDTILILCPECKSRKFYYDELHDETTCKRCGLVVEAPPVFGLVYPEVLRLLLTCNKEIEK